jgi:hypothetical protein
MNSHVDTLFEKQNRVNYFITIGAIVRRANERETTVKGNNVDRWIFDGVVLWLRRRQNRDVIE